MLLSLICCSMVAYGLYKARQIHRTLYGTDFVARNLSSEILRNVQNLDLLAHELDLGRPLPPLRGWVASPDVLLILARHIRRFTPEVIVECGSGASTIVLARAAQLNGRGRVVSIDHDAAFAESTREMLRDFGLADCAEVIFAPLRQVEVDGSSWEWYGLDAWPNAAPIDLLFVDGPPGDAPRPLARYPAGPMLFPWLSPDGAVFVDDTDRPGESEILKRWHAEFPQLTQRVHLCEKGCYELRREAPSAPKVPDRVMPAEVTPRRIVSS